MTTRPGRGDASHSGIDQNGVTGVRKSDRVTSRLVMTGPVTMNVVVVGGSVQTLISPAATKDPAVNARTETEVHNGMPANTMTATAGEAAMGGNVMSPVSPTAPAQGLPSLLMQVDEEESQLLKMRWRTRRPLRVQRPCLTT